MAKRMSAPVTIGKRKDAEGQALSLFQSYQEQARAVADPNNWNAQPVHQLSDELAAIANSVTQQTGIDMTASDVEGILTGDTGSGWHLTSKALATPAGMSAYATHEVAEARQHQGDSEALAAAIKRGLTSGRKLKINL